MNNMKFKAFAVTNEIDLNKIAIQCNIPKKYTWEEPLILEGDVLGIILEKSVPEMQMVLVFSFGSTVFINAPPGDIHKFFTYLKAFKPEIDLKGIDTYAEDYDLRIDTKREFELTDKYVIAPKFEYYYPELISVVIAKSVALEKTEEQLGKILDSLESTIDRLEKGNMGVSDKQLARTISGIVRHEYNSIAYIMILDKPGITWSNSLAGDFYETMSEFFELNDRYVILKEKSNILNNIINGFSSISHSIRGLFVEWIIVLLIVAEIILMVADMFK